MNFAEQVHALKHTDFDAAHEAKQDRAYVRELREEREFESLRDEQASVIANEFDQRTNDALDRIAKALLLDDVPNLADVREFQEAGREATRRLWATD